MRDTDRTNDAVASFVRNAALEVSA